MAEQAQQYPLKWPAGWKRTPNLEQQLANFGKSVTRETANADGSRNQFSLKESLSPVDAARRLQVECDRLGATSAILSTNLELRMDGTPRADRRDPYDVGAAVYFTLEGKPICLACDKWTRVADNIAALAQHIDALRRIDRYGVGRMAQAFAGYSLPAQATPSDWTRVLKVPETATRDEINTAYRRLAADHHPDRGGDVDEMILLNAARDAALKSRPQAR